MKNLTYIFLFLFISSIYGQDMNFINSNSNLINLQNDFLEMQSNKLNSTSLFSEIIIPKNKIIKETSEGKFLYNAKTKEYFKTIENNNNANENTHLYADNNEEFINKIIIKKLDDELIEILVLNESFEYGDRNIDLYRDYESLKNKLIIRKNINDNVEIQIGKSLYPYLNKILKTELDKTLQNSLNLLAINF